MSTVAPRIPSGAVQLVAQAIDGVKRQFRLRGPVEDQWGRSESIDPDNVGDIADEGAGHRG